MKMRKPYSMPPEKKKKLDYVVKLEWWSVGLRFSIVVVLGMVLGNSQAMKAAWIEDTIGLTPSIAFLIAMRFRNRDPDESYPYGYQRAAVIAFLCAAVALSLFGLYLLGDSLVKLISQEHTTIGAIHIQGHTIWLGWLMLAALTYSVILPFILGHMQEKAAMSIHEKTVLVDARMSKADWTTGLAAMIGVVGVGFGYWWADAVAGGLIALSVSRDGITNLKEAAGDLLDRQPHKMGTSEPDPLAEEMEDRLCELDWVFSARVRLREEGHVLSGEAFIVPTHVEDPRLVKRIAEAEELLENFDWRIHEMVVMPVTNQDHEAGSRPRQRSGRPAG